MERRFVEAQEVRAQEEAGKPNRLTGYAAVFSRFTDISGFFREQIAPGAFSRSLQEDDIRALWNHDSNLPLGRNKNSTLRLSEDETGLRFQLDLPDTQAGRDALVSVRRGDVTGMSFGFDVRKDEWVTVAGKKERTLMDVVLQDISPVTFPAYEEAQVEARSLEVIATEGERRLAAVPAPDRDLAERQDRTRLARLT